MSLRHVSFTGSDNILRITSEDVQRNIPKAVQWVTQMEQACMEIGQPLLPQNRQDSEAIGIRELAAVRVMVLNEIPLPSDLELRRLALESSLWRARITWRFDSKIQSSKKRGRSVG